jgi:hypothetical protein
MGPLKKMSIMGPGEKWSSSLLNGPGWAHDTWAKISDFATNVSKTESNPANSSLLNHWEPRTATDPPDRPSAVASFQKTYYRHFMGLPRAQNTVDKTCHENSPWPDGPRRDDKYKRYIWDSGFLFRKSNSPGGGCGETPIAARHVLKPICAAGRPLRVH